MKMTRLLLCLLPALPAVLAAQAYRPATQVYHSDALAFDLRYLAAFQREEPGALTEVDGALFRLNPLLPADPCAPVIMALSTGLHAGEPAVKHSAIKGMLHRRNAPATAPWGTVALTELDRNCLPKGALDDDILAGLVGRSTDSVNVVTLSRLSNSYMQGTTVWTAATAAFNRDAKGRREAAAGTTLSGTMGAVVHGHLLIWQVAANEPATFNRMLDLSVCLDAPACSEGYSQLTDFQVAVRSPQQSAATQPAPASELAAR